MDDRIEHIKEDLEEVIYKTLEANESTNFKHINTCELGQVIDMLKDIAETIYYCKVSEAMEAGGQIPTMIVK